jgi:hypothetical protein
VPPGVIRHQTTFHPDSKPAEEVDVEHHARSIPSSAGEPAAGFRVDAVATCSPAHIAGARAPPHDRAGGCVLTSQTRSGS